MIYDGMRAEVSGGIIAGLAAGPLYGVGAPWLQKLMPWAAHTRDNPEGGMLMSPQPPQQNTEKSRPDEQSQQRSSQQVLHAS